MVRLSLGLRLIRRKARSAESPATAANAARARVAVHIASVAVLDDDDDVSTAIAQSLQRAGYSSSSYTNEETLLAAAASTPFDCLIADWSLGQRTSASTIARLRRIDGYSATPVIVLSGQLCVNGAPVAEDLRSAIATLDLIFRSKPRTTADIVRDLQSLCHHVLD